MRDDTSEFEFEVSCKPDFAYLNVQVPEGVTLKVESSAMACMDTNMKMKTKMRGGLGRMFTGESLFINEFTAEGAPAEIGIAPGAPGIWRMSTWKAVTMRSICRIPATWHPVSAWIWRPSGKGW